MNGYRWASPAPGFLGATRSSAGYNILALKSNMASMLLLRAIIPLAMVSSGLFSAYPQHQRDACVAILAHFLEFPWFETFIIDNFQNSFGLKLHFATDGTCLRVRPNRSLRIIIAILRTERRPKWAAGSHAGASFTEALPQHSECAGVWP